MALATVILYCGKALSLDFKRLEGEKPTHQKDDGKKNDQQPFSQDEIDQLADHRRYLSVCS